MHRLFVLLLCTFVALIFSLPAAALEREHEVRIGVLAKRGSERTLQQWNPTAEYLTREVHGHHFSIVPLSFEAIGSAVKSGSVDFVLTNSGIYVELEARYGAGRIATLRNHDGDYGYTLFGGVIFTRAERDDIRTLEELRGKRLAAVNADSLGGYLMAWRELEGIGITPGKDTALSFSGTHDAVVYAVLRGLADAGTVRTDTLERMQAEGKIDLAELKALNPRHYDGFEYLCSTRLYPEWPIARLRHTPESLTHDVAAALLRMTPDSPAAKAGLIEGWTVPRNYQPVHDMMRELHVGPYADLGRISLEDFLRFYWHWLLLAMVALLLSSSVTAYVLRLNIRLRRTESELIEARDHLAERVRERTAELEESHRRLERISRDWNDAFDAISDPIFIHDSAMRIVQANPAYCERAGFSLDEMVGRPYYEFFPRREGPLPSCEVFPETLQVEGDELQLESGEVFVSRSFGIRRADNTVRHAIHILEDVTAVRRAESRRRILSRAIEQTDEGVLILDRQRSVLYCNPGLRRMLGREVHDEPCQSGVDTITDLVSRHFTASLQRLFKDAEKKSSASAEMELATVDGTRPAFITVGSILNEEGVIDGYVMTLLDLSAIKQATEELTYRIGFESVLAQVASSLVNVDAAHLDDEVNTALGLLGEFAATDRVYLFRYDAADDTISNTYKWCAPGSTLQSEALQRLPLQSLPWLRERLLAGEVVSIADVDLLPEEAGAERTEFQREAVLSLLNVPLSYAGAFAGFIGFDNVRQRRDWAEEDVRLLRTAGEIIINTFGRMEAMSSLLQSEASLAAAQQIAHLGNWDWNILTGELAWSDEIYRIFGLLPHQFGATYEAFLETVHPDDRESVVNAVNRAVAGESDYEIDHRIICPDGSIRTVHEVGEVQFMKSGTPYRMIGTVQDVSDLRQAEHETKRLNRALRALSLCNTTLVHAEFEQTLLQDICHILIDHGGYQFAWVGYADEEGSRIRPVARAGEEGDFLDTLELGWSDEASGQQPTGHAIRLREVFIAHHPDEMAQMYDPWFKVIRATGTNAVIALPLASQGEIFGAITIHAAEAPAFDKAEVRLLIEMSNDLAFGIRTLRNRRARDLAEEALSITEKRYEELYENAPNGYLSVSAEDGRLLQLNRAVCDILGYDRETLLGMKVFDLYADTADGLAKAKAVFAGFKQGQGTRDVELQMRHRDGHPVWVSVSIDPVTDEWGKVVESRSMVIDISARKRAEEEQQRFADQLQRSLFQTIRAIALTIEKRDPYTAGHQERVAELAVKIGLSMGLDEQRLEGLRLGAMIHDIGKISVPAEILNRPGQLESALLHIIQTHPMVGYDIIRGIDFPWPLAEMVLQHHERLNGSGYPKGLAGDEILLEARILAVADVVEAMVSHRPYRPALGTRSARDEILQGKGVLYDPEVVEHCLELIDENELPWRESE